MPLPRSLFAALVVGSACAHSPGHAGASTPSTPDSFQSLVDAPDRLPADRALDAGRKPVAFLDFLGVKPGQHVGEIFSGGGYTTELLARAVGPTGVVYGHNTPGILKMFAEKPWSARLERPVNKNVIRSDRELDDPFPPEATNLDLVVSNANYHDAVNMKVDRSKMNGAIFRALRSGGAYVVCDSSAKDGTGTQDTDTLHRIDEQVVRTEIPQVGFKFAEEGSFLRNPADSRDWSASPVSAGARRGTGDRFCLKYVKP